VQFTILQALSGTLDNVSNGSVYFTIAILLKRKSRNGAPDGMALVDNGAVVQFF